MVSSPLSLPPAEYTLVIIILILPASVGGRWTLPDTLIVKYADNWLNDGEPLGYEDEWLKEVGYENGPPPPPKEPNAVA